MTQEKDEPSRYWAFLSYSHHDKRVARRLCRELALRAVPRAFRSRVSGADSRFRRIFLDEQESGANAELSTELRTALEGSRKLIVICSPFAVASAYVRREIRYFQSLGRAADILCIVASGVPNATDVGQPALECFPAPLRERIAAKGGIIPTQPDERPLAATIGLESAPEWTTAVDQLVAGLLDISRGDLRRLHGQQRARWLIHLALAAAGIVAILAGLSWAYLLTHVTYASSYLRRNGLWQEVDPISRAESTHRARSLRFERRGAKGPLVAVNVVNGSGQCATEGFRSITGDDYGSKCSVVRACRVNFRYATNGELEQEAMHDQYGNTLETLTYSLPSVAIVSEAVIGCSRARSGIKFVEFEREDERSGPQFGLDQRLRFKGDDHRDPRANHEHAFGLQYKYDDRGRIKERWTLDENGEPTASIEGPAGKLLTYDAAGNLIRADLVDAQGQPTKNNRGFATARYERDAHGNLTRESFLDEQGQPVYDKEGVSFIETSRDLHGEPASRRFLDTAGRTSVNSEGFALERMTVDARGFLVERRFFDAQRRPTRGGKEKCFALRFVLNETGGATSTGCFDAAGRRAVNYMGYHELRIKLGARGDQESESFWDIHGEPVNCTKEANAFDPDNACPLQVQINSFDIAGNRVRARAYLADRSPSAAIQGSMGWDSTFNGFGYELTTVQIGVTGLPAPDTNDVIGVLGEPDRFGRDAQLEYVDARLQPRPSSEGILWVRLTYDDTRHETRRELLNALQQPTLNSQGIAGWTVTSDLLGNEVTTRYFGLHGEPVRSQDGSFGERSTYDRFQRLVRREWLAADGTVAVLDEGYAMATFERDTIGNVIHTRVLDTNSLPVLDRDGSAGFDTEYDSFGYETKRVYVGLTGHPAKNKLGVCVEIFERDARERIMANRFLNCNGHPTGKQTDPAVSTVIERWDERDRQVAEWYLDASGARARGVKSGGWLWKYDAGDRVVERTSLGIDEKPSPNRSGEMVTLNSYDSSGRLVEESILGADYTVHRVVVHQHDRFGREVRRLQLGADRRPLLAPESGRAEARFTYDGSGRLIQEASFGVQAEAVNRRDYGWSQHRMIYDANGHLLDEHCLKVNGAEVKPCRSD